MDNITKYNFRTDLKLIRELKYNKFNNLHLEYTCNTKQLLSLELLAKNKELRSPLAVIGYIQKSGSWALVTIKSFARCINKVRPLVLSWFSSSRNASIEEKAHTSELVGKAHALEKIKQQIAESQLQMRTLTSKAKSDENAKLQRLLSQKNQIILAMEACI